MVVAGSMIGSGIFIVSSDITRYTGSAGWLIFGLAYYGLYDHYCRSNLW